MLPIYNNMADKNYEPEIIQENDFPGEVSQTISQTQTGTGDNYSPGTDKEKTFPTKRTAVELLSTALNTRSRKILEKFDLVQSGGIQIGDFKEGISGDVRITPNGLTGRNIAGLATFALDTDGNLTLVGELRSGSTITGQVVVGNNGVIIDVDDNGNPSIIVNDGTHDRVIIGYSANGF